ncbi:adenylate/guanylate cyclase domain-containing protein [Roseobacteraceae bacterium NS-SX3]
MVDVVGYSKLVREDEGGTISRLRALHREVIAPCVSRHGGRIVKSMGDGLMIEFPSAVEALQAAIDIQSPALEDGSAPVEDGNPTVPNGGLQLRIGANLGDVVAAEDDLFGDDVNIAARIEQIAGPGEICLSENLFRQVRGKVTAGFEDLGEYALKNINEPVRLYRVSAAAAPQDAPAAAVAELPPYQPPRIAVLPLEADPGDADCEALADAVTGELISGLSRFRDFLVVARQSCFQFKGTGAPVSKVVQALDAGFIVEGSLHCNGGQLKLTVNLVEGGSEASLWTETYDAGEDSSSGLHGNLLPGIVQTLAGRLQSFMARQALLKGQGNGPLSAEEMVLQGKAIICDSREKLMQCRELYQRAAAAGPGCSRAYASLSASYVFEWTSGWSESREETLDKALEYSRQAILLDDLDSEAQRRAGVLHLFRGEHAQARSHLERAMQLNPYDAHTPAYYGLYLIYDGRPAEALRVFEQSTRGNPFHPSYYHWFIGLAHYMAGDYPAAISSLTQAAELHPAFVTPHRHLAACYARQGKAVQATAERQRVLELEPDFSIGKLARTLAYRDPAHRQNYCDGLRLAGLPD